MLAGRGSRAWIWSLATAGCVLLAGCGSAAPHFSRNEGPPPCGGRRVAVIRPPRLEGMTEQQVCAAVGSPDHFETVGHRDIWNYVRGGKVLLRVAFDHGAVESYGGFATKRS